MERNTVNHSAHSTWRCQYHIVFAPKFRRKVIYGELKADIGKILTKLCEEKKVEIIEAEECVDHIHMLVSIPPHISVSQFMGYLKETLIKSSSAADGSFAPTFAYKNLEIHTVFLRFLTQNLSQNLSPAALAYLISVSFRG